MERGKISIKEMQKYWGSMLEKFAQIENHFMYIPTERGLNVVTWELIEHLIKLENSDGLFLDIGSGALPQVYYPKELLPIIIAADLSGDLLQHNPASGKVQCDANRTLPFASNTFTFASAFFVNRYLTNPENMVAEAARVLRPGSEFLIIDYVINGNPAENNIFNPLALRKYMMQVGFCDIEIKPILPESGGKNGEPYIGPLLALYGKM